MEKNAPGPENDKNISDLSEAEQLPLLGNAGGIDLPTLRRQRELLRAEQLSGETLRCYESDWRVFVGWCMRAGRRPLPASTETLTLYSTWQLTQRQRRVTTAARHISAILQHHRRSGVEPPDSREAKQLIANVKRRRREQPRGKNALTPEQLRRMMEACDPSKPRGVRDRALILLGFSSSLRRSEVAALQLCDITFRPEGIAVYVPHSKTDQGGRGRTVGIWAGQHELTDPVRALKRWLEVRGEWQGALFARMGRGRNMQQIVLGHGICGQSVAKVVKYAAQKAGLDFDGISGHSLRAGAVTAAANTGSSDAEIMKMTGHANLSTMRRYVRDIHAFGGRNPLAGVL